MLRPIIVAAVTAAAVLATATASQAGDSIRRACVVGIDHGSHLNVREYAYRSARIIRRLYRGDCITVVGVCEPGTNDWCNVHFSNREDGMASAQYLRFADEYTTRPVPRKRDWYAIASCSRNYGPANRVANRFRRGYVVDTSDPYYPNFRGGYYCAVSGPHKRWKAKRRAARLRDRGFHSAYFKRAH